MEMRIYLSSWRIGMDLCGIFLLKIKMKEGKKKYLAIKRNILLRVRNLVYTYSMLKLDNYIRRNV